MLATMNWRKIVSLGYQFDKMDLGISQIKRRDGILAYPPSHSPLLPPHPASVSSPYIHLAAYEKDSSPSPPTSSGSKISPAILFIIIILAVVFFISGLLHLLVRFLIKQPSSNPSAQSSNYPEVPHSDAIQRQLQQLFHLHDSGLDQAFIDSLPVFLYKDIMGLKEPFDCAVCLCEFSEQDKLRLLPLCGHAFHINCIDTWLLSNSTCPLCRGTLYASGFPFENPVFEFNDEREEDGFSGEVEDGHPGGQKPAELEETGGLEKRVFSVRLGKFRSSNGDEGGGGGGETSSSNLDGRRCFSMGSYQYVVGDSNLQVTYCGNRDGNGDGRKQQQMKTRGCDGNFSIEVDVEGGKKLCGGSKGESFSVSKIWLWSKKGKSTSSSDAQLGNGILPPHSSNSGLPWIERTHNV